jgi:hypothetical protein
LKRKKLCDAFKRESGTIFSRTTAFACWRLRRKKESSIFANLPDAVDLMFEERSNKRFFHVPCIAEKQGVPAVISMFMSEQYEDKSNLEFRSVSIFVHEVHVDGNGGVFAVVLRNREKGDKELRKGVIGSVDFVSMVKVKVGARGFFRRSEAECIVDSPNGSRIRIEFPSEQEPSNSERKDGKPRFFNDFVVSGPVVKEADGKKRVRNMARRGRNATNEKFNGRRTKFFGDMLKDRRNPFSDGIENENVHKKPS